MTTYQVMPEMPPEQYKALKADIAARGVITAIDLDEAGTVLDGHHRVRACQELGITEYPTVIRTGLTEDEKRLFARKANTLRRHLTRQQIREILAAQLKDTPHWADNRIARELSVDSKTVTSERRRLEATSEIPKLTELEGTDGKVRHQRRPAIMVATEAEREQILQALRDGGVDVTTLPDGFLDGGMVMRGKSPTDEAWESLGPKESASLGAFGDYLATLDWSDKGGIGAHLDWLARHEWTVNAWLGDEGDRYRSRFHWRNPSKAFKKAALAFVKQQCEALAHRIP